MDKLLSNWFGKSFRKICPKNVPPPICAKNVPKRPKPPLISARNVPKLPEVSLFEPRKKVKEKDSDLKISSPVVQIARKGRKKKIKLLRK